MKKIIALLFLCLSISHGQQAQDTSGRYQIVVVPVPGSIPMLIKLDTATGQTWQMQFAPDDWKKLGVTILWSKVPDLGFPSELTKAATPAPADPYAGIGRPVTPAPAKSP